MAETAQPETAPDTTNRDAPDTDVATATSTGPAEAVQQARRLDPALRSLDTRPLRHVHHGQTAAMWTAVSCVFAGFLVGGILFVLHLQTAGIIAGGVLCIVGIVAGLILQALGLGLYDKKKS